MKMRFTRLAAHLAIRLRANSTLRIVGAVARLKLDNLRQIYNQTSCCYMGRLKMQDVKMTDHQNHAA